MPNLRIALNSGERDLLISALDSLHRGLVPANPDDFRQESREGLAIVRESVRKLRARLTPEPLEYLERVDTPRAIDPSRQ